MSRPTGTGDGPIRWLERRKRRSKWMPIPAPGISSTIVLCANYSTAAMCPQGVGNGRVVRSSPPGHAPTRRGDASSWKCRLSPVWFFPAKILGGRNRAQGSTAIHAPFPEEGRQIYPWPGISASSATSRVPPIPRKGQALAIARAACMESA